MIKCILLISCLFSIPAMAAVINISYVIKSNGDLVATSDLGGFTTTNNTLEITEGQFPSDMNNETKESTFPAKESYIITPVGYVVRSANSVQGKYADISFRVKDFVGKGTPSSRYLARSCSVSSGISSGLYRILTDGKPWDMACESTQGTAPSSQNAITFKANYVNIVFMEQTAGLLEQKLPAGTYVFTPKVFKLSHIWLVSGVGNWVTRSTNMEIRVKVVVEPSIASVNMPTALPLDVAVETGSRVTGKGSVLATVSGTLGQNLKILPRSTNNGQLVKGSERIPYTLSVVPLSGDNKSRLLIDGNNGGAQPEVVMSTDDKLDQYQLRFDASFSSTLSGLSTGRFSDNVTLMFTTTDMP